MVTIVTGAGSGIGRAIAARLGRAGHRLVLAGRRDVPLRETAEMVGKDAAVIVADVSDPAAAASVVDLAVARFGRLDGLVNNAGVVDVAPVAETTGETLGRTFAANAFGPAHLVARAWPIFARQGAGCVVNVTSMAVVDPFPGLSVYAMSKAALDSLTRSIRAEGAEMGIRAYSIAPGAVETSMLRRVVTIEQLPPDDTLRPDDIAKVVEACLEDRRPEQSGSTIRVPG